MYLFEVKGYVLIHINENLDGFNCKPLFYQQSSRQPFKNAPQKQPEFEYPSTFNHNKIYVRPAQQAELDFNLRPKRKRKSQNEGRFNEGRRFPFAAHDKPTNYVDFRARPRQPTRKRFDNLENTQQVRNLLLLLLFNFGINY